jgi:hypothetical protein
MSEGPTYRCFAEPPHRLRLDARVATSRGLRLAISDADAPEGAPRDLFVTNAELKMGYDSVFKPCFVCVDAGRKEKAFAIPKSDLE